MYTNIHFIKKIDEFDFQQMNVLRLKNFNFLIIFFLTYVIKEFEKFVIH